MHPVSAAALRIPENRLRFIVPPDIGGGFGIKSSMFPQMVMTALAAKKTGVPVKYIEDRMEHLMSSSSGTDRVKIEPPPRIGTRLHSEFMKGMGNLGDKFVIILDINKVFSADDPRNGATPRNASRRLLFLSPPQFLINPFLQKYLNQGLVRHIPLVGQQPDFIQHRYR